MRKETIKISFIGAGRLATHLSIALSDAGFTIHEIYSRNLSTAQNLAKKIKGSTATNSTDFSKSEASLFIMAVPDHVIAQVAESIILPSTSALVHTSGSTHLNVLKNKNWSSGVLYPLQTFSSNKIVDFKDVPFCVEADSQPLKISLFSISKTISNKVFEVGSEARKKIHLAAVFACNFNNYILGISEEILQDEELPLSILQPLVFETINKAFLVGPSNAQTGPAARNDENTIQTHFELLKNKKEYLDLYKQCTVNIVKKYYKKSPLE